MRAVVQRVAEARVLIEGRAVGEIGRGLLVLLGVATGDGRGEVDWMVDKLLHLRIFNDEESKMNRSLFDTGGEALVVSQFTLYGDARKGRRPSFVRAARGRDAEEVYDAVVAGLRTAGISCASGRFGAMMQVELTNDGPVTIILDSERIL